MCTHIRGVRKLYSLPSETDDIDKKIRQSSNGRRWAKVQRVVLLPRFIQQQFRLIPFMEKNCEGAKLTAQCVYTFYQLLFIHQCHGKMSFSQGILCTVMHEVPLLFLAPTDNNNLSLCSFTANIPLPPSLPSLPPPFG